MGPRRLSSEHRKPIDYQLTLMLVISWFESVDLVRISTTELSPLNLIKVVIADLKFATFYFNFIWSRIGMQLVASGKRLSKGSWVSISSFPLCGGRVPAF